MALKLCSSTNIAQARLTKSKIDLYPCVCSSLYMYNVYKKRHERQQNIFEDWKKILFFCIGRDINAIMMMKTGI